MESISKRMRVNLPQTRSAITPPLRRLLVWLRERGTTPSGSKCWITLMRRKMVAPRMSSGEATEREDVGLVNGLHNPDCSLYCFRFKLNLALGQYMEAARDAMEMARFEQEEGNYRVAHDKLFTTVQQLESMGKAVPTELTRMLSLLHRCVWGISISLIPSANMLRVYFPMPYNPYCCSYTLVKSLIAVEDHVTAARMLVRVARNISKFPKVSFPHFVSYLFASAVCNTRIFMLLRSTWCRSSHPPSSSVMVLGLRRRHLSMPRC